MTFIVKKKYIYYILLFFFLHILQLFFCVLQNYVMDYLLNFTFTELMCKNYLQSCFNTKAVLLFITLVQGY